MKKNLLSVAFVLTLLFNLSAQTIRYQQNIRGGFAIAANALPLKSGTWAKTDGGTTTSSYSDLILPAGSTIVKAFLYAENYGGYSLLGGNPITSLKFKVPGGAYVTLNNASAGFIGNPSSGGSYGLFIIDVTSLIPASGYVSTLTPGGNAGTTGRYSVSDPTVSSGSIAIGDGWGWSLFVVYTNPGAKFRNVTIADACNTTSSDLIIPNISVPSAGPVNAVVAITGSWGDIGLTDYGSFGKAGTALTGLIDPTTLASNDILNSTIGFCPQNNVSADGGPAMSGNYTGRNPYNTFTQPTSGSGTWGSYFYDADIFNTSGVLPNSATPISVEFKQASGGGDAIGFGAYAVSVDITAALITKSLFPTSIADGGTAAYTWTVDNTFAGALNQVGINFTDNLPSGIIIANPPAITVTGGTGTAPTVTAVAGGTSVKLTGLNLNIGQTATISVNVTNVPGHLNADCSTNPLAFTNSFSNITGITANLANGVTPQCLIVGVAVPIELLDFKGKSESDKIYLNWSTGSEKNTDYFSIERSFGGAGFFPIGKVSAAGNSELTRKYIFVDNKIASDNIYYRLKIIDNDGKYKYSNLLDINTLKTITNTIVSPTPCRDNATVTFLSSKESEGHIAIYDLTGRKVKQLADKEILSGENELKIDLSDLNKGLYFLYITDNSGLQEKIKLFLF